MTGTESTVDHKLEIPPLESSRRRVVVILAAALAAGVGLGTYLFTRGPEQSPYRIARVSKASIVKEIRALVASME